MNRSRELQVGSARLHRWVTGFAERHGEVVVSSGGAGLVRLEAQDGASAVLHVMFPFEPLDLPPAPTPAQAAAAVALNADAGRDLAVVLIRRGGYAVAAMLAGQVTASKVGSKYVQGRTAAGGWSQQRFARRRDGQVHGLLVAAADVAVRLLTPVRASCLVTGGDKTLVERLLADPRLAGLTRLPRGPHLPVGDPRNEDVKALPVTLREVRIQLTEPG